MATEDEMRNLENEGGSGLGGSAEQRKEGQKDRESTNPYGVKGNRKEMSSGESSGKAGGSRQGTQENKEGRNKDRGSPGNSEGVVSKKVRVTDARRKLAEIDKRTAEYNARLIEAMMIGNEENSVQEVPRDERKTIRGGTGQGDKGSDRGGTPSKRRKEGENSPGMEAEKATNPLAIDSRASRLPTSPAASRGCEGLSSLREGVLGWFDPEGTAKTRGGQKTTKEGSDTSMAGKASSSEGGLRKIVSSLTRALNKNQGYLADAKKKLTFDGANITEFLIDYENLAALLKWTEEEKMNHLGQHVSLSLGRDIMVIVAARRDRVNATTRLGTVGRRINRDTIMEEVAGSSEPQTEPETEEPEKVYGKPREEEPADKVTAAKKKFRYQIPILTLPELDDTISKLLGTMVSVSFQTMLQASPRLLKGLRQLLSRRRVEIGDNPELPEGEREEEAPQEVANLQRSHGDLEDLEKAFADIRLSLPDREGGEVMRSPPGTKLSFHALPVGKLKIQIGSHHTDALVDGEAEITLIRRDFTTITGCTVNKEVTGSIRGAGGEIPFVGKIPEGSVRKYKPIGKKARPVSILLETSKEEAMEKEEEVLRVIRKRRATEGHRIPDEVADIMKIRIYGFLTEEETRLIKRTCQEFHLAFAFSDHQKGRLNAKLIPQLRIHTVEHECWNDKGSSYEFGKAGEVTDLLRAKLDSFVTEPTASSYANRWFVFRKPNKTLRWIQDLQKLNAVTIRDADSLPQADLFAESHAGQSIYSLIDLYSGYDQLPLDVRDMPYTAILTPVGQLQMQVTPMGFTNAVAEAQCRMLAVAEDMFPEKCESYIDDNPIKGAQEKDETEVQPGIRRFVWDHLQDIKDLLRRFLVYNITVSGPKSILAVSEVTILGFRCGAYGRKPDPAKTDKISQWPTPLRTTTEVRAFLGVVGFWRIFIKNFAKIAEPIRAMIREEGTMDWTEEREGDVQRLKGILTSETVALFAPCFNDEVGRPFILETDGGPLAVGGVLIQRDEGEKKRPIRFESRTLNSVERRYSQFKKEVLAILHCLKTFQAYLFGRRFILRIDPTNVEGALKNYMPIHLMVGRWVGFI
ncbi:hypothetical protein CBR_g23212 [Chara braunii]|uniref:Uncharacterized protein n=1 Tax=Chara braunii TaxID=69332 RepID=A0A388JVA0_CHABU|nr:hypothetical protein CBR_g23212 [Chara braunii]|eukprot:GBG61697.1 hypothetical protein CBR_g23212 [Chara braunii]